MTNRLRMVPWVATAGILAGGLALWHFWPVVTSTATGPTREVDPSATELYTCGMHPQVVQEGPGQCPLCGMTLIPIKDSAPARDQEGGVRVSTRFVQNFAVRTTVVERVDLSARIRTIGYLDQDQAKIVSVGPRYEGWIEGSQVNTVGERVLEGELLFEVYSPELVTAQEEFLGAGDYVARLRAARADPDAISRAELLQQAAGERLLHWEMTSPQIDDLRAAGEASRTLPVRSPTAGYVVEKMGDALEGARVGPGTTVLKIADQSTLWAKIEFYEHYLRDLRPGMRAKILVDAFPGRSWSGRLLFFEPAMNPHTQTLTGYVEVDNSDGRLRPKMYANVEIELPGVRNALVVPTQSVLRTGASRSVVIVAAGDGLFVPHAVELGLESTGQVQVVSGLTEGDLVVTSAQFLLDSESNLQAAVERLWDSHVH